MSYTITIPDVPPSLNRVLRMHWAKKARLKTQWSSSFWLFPPGESFKLRALAHLRRKMRLKITLHNARQYDKDNAYGACKMIVDALRDCKFIHDDRPEFLDLQIEQVKSTRKDKKTVIEIGAADSGNRG